MGILSRYVLRQIAVPSLLAVAVVAILGVANEIQEEQRDTILPLAQMTMGDLGRLVMYFLPALVGYLIPITYMLGIMLAFGRFSHDNEIVAMKAAGIPIKRIVLPIILVGAVLSGASFWIQDRIHPWAVRRADEFIHGELPLRATLEVLPTGVIQEYGGWRIYIGKKDPAEGTLEKIVILKPEENGGASTYYAESAKISKQNGRNMLELANVHFIQSGEGNDIMPLRADTTSLPIPQIKTRIPDSGRNAMNLRQLLSNETTLAGQIAQTPSEPAKLELLKVRRDIADRLSLPFACLAVSLAAAPLGARAKRSGRSYTFAVGFSVLLIYYVLQMLVEGHSLQPLWLTVLRLWVPNLLFCLAGLFFLWRVDRV
ncbi:MAG: LptF/LptG family permease [Candidatus Hydrogenedentes bacterium]|nr:LptF/LptG family permease [Candidatus Hydrogenedentota bacterium]